MTRGRARRYLLTKQGYYPGVVASIGYDVWDWSTLNAGTLFQDSAKTTPASANGDVIGCWTDGVGGVDATQVTTANKPGLATASLNGLTTLSFDGSDMLATGNIGISTFAVWVVFTATAGTIVIEHSVNANSNDGMYILTDRLSNIVVRRSAVNTSRNITASLATNTYYLYRAQHNGTHTSLQVYLDGVLDSASGTSNNIGTGTATQPLFIGARSGVAVPMTGNIAHLCIVSPYPTDASILVNMESYINGLWGVY